MWLNTEIPIKLPPTAVESFLILIFNLRLKHTGKMVLTGNCYIWYSNINRLREASGLLKMWIYWGLKEARTRYEQIYSADNRWQNVWRKAKKLKQNWTRPKNRDICLCVSFNCYCQKLISWEGRLDTRLCSHPNLRFSFYFLISYDLEP